ncbi:MAG: hypothetical protein V3S68_07780 [Dehalococcoidia bacterium]
MKHVHIGKFWMVVLATFAVALLTTGVAFAGEGDEDRDDDRDRDRDRFFDDERARRWRFDDDRFLMTIVSGGGASSMTACWFAN